MSAKNKPANPINSLYSLTTFIRFAKELGVLPSNGNAMYKKDSYTDILMKSV